MYAKDADAPGRLGAVLEPFQVEPDTGSLVEDLRARRAGAPSARSSARSSAPAYAARLAPTTTYRSCVT